MRIITTNRITTTIFTTPSGKIDHYGREDRTIKVMNVSEGDMAAMHHAIVAALEYVAQAKQG